MTPYDYGVAVRVETERKVPNRHAGPPGKYTVTEHFFHPFTLLNKEKRPHGGSRQVITMLSAGEEVFKVDMGNRRPMYHCGGDQFARGSSSRDGGFDSAAAMMWELSREWSYAGYKEDNPHVVRGPAKYAGNILFSTFVCWVVKVEWASSKWDRVRRDWEKAQ